MRHRWSWGNETQLVIEHGVTIAGDIEHGVTIAGDTVREYLEALAVAQTLDVFTRGA